MGLHQQLRVTEDQPWNVSHTRSCVLFTPLSPLTWTWCTSDPALPDLLRTAPEPAPGSGQHRGQQPCAYVGPGPTGLSRAWAGRVTESRVDNRLRVQPSLQRRAQASPPQKQPACSAQDRRAQDVLGRGPPERRRRRAREGQGRWGRPSRAGRTFPLPGGRETGLAWDPLGPPTQPAKTEEGRFNHCAHPAHGIRLLRSRASAVKT